uniref:Uncharacterized protein n=1 Tax=Anopheles maculatus TaxID=74869 RepID=A0A182T4B0_9DIPT
MTPTHISKDHKGLDDSVKLIQSLGGLCKGYKVDISNKEEVYKFAKIIQEDIGDVTLLFNNAGVVSGRALLDTPDHLIERSFSVNVLAHFWVGFDEALRLELEHLRAQGVFTTVICPYFIQSTGMFDDVNSRWVPTLDSNDVADKIIEGVQKNEKYVIIPGYLRLMLAIKWVFPWGCNSGFLRRLVPDAAPQHSMTSLSNAECDSTKEMANTFASDNNNTTKSSPLLVHRQCTGERVL